jgi:hypothetical protein
MSDAATELPNARQLIAALDVDDSHVLAKKLPLAEATAEALADAREKLHNVGRQLMARAKRDTGHVYTGEVVRGQTSRGDPVVFFLVTRTA